MAVMGGSALDRVPTGKLAGDVVEPTSLSLAHVGGR